MKICVNPWTNSLLGVASLRCLGDSAFVPAAAGRERLAASQVAVDHFGFTMAGMNTGGVRCTWGARAGAGGAFRLDPMKHHAFTALAAVSLAACLAAAVLWARGYWWLDRCDGRITGGDSVRDYKVLSAFGRLVFYTRRVGVADTALTPVGPSKGPEWKRERAGPGDRARFDAEVDGASEHRALGAGFTRWADAGESRTLLVIPHPYVFALAATAPLFRARGWVRRRRARSRAARGLCPRCGYDLRASEGACPECGEPVKADQRLQ